MEVRTIIQALVVTLDSMTTLLDFKQTQAYLAYLGFDYWSKTRPQQKEPAVALNVLPSRAVERKSRKIARQIFHCFVFGSTGSGKVRLL
jgi:hypothetical protein